MLLEDDDIEIIDTNNNESESLKKPDKEKNHNDSIEIISDYEVVDEQNVKEIKVLFVRENVAERIFTMDVPLLFDELDILSTVFPDFPIYQDVIGFRMVDKDQIEKIIQWVRVDEPNSTYQYRLEINTPKTKLPPLKFPDCHIEEYIQSDLPMEPAPVNCSSPTKSVDSQDTYFEAAEMKEDSSEDDAFMSCLDDENDITVTKNNKFFSCPDANAMDIDLEKNEKNCDALFEILNQDESSQEEIVEERQTIRDSPSTSKSCEIEASKFYSPSIIKRNEFERFSSPSQSTIQLDDSPVLKKRRSQRNSKSPRDSILAVYPPPPEKGGIPIYKENYMCLADGEYLNDVIIDFYLKYLMTEVLSDEDRNRTHTFSSQFFTRLSKPPVANNNAQVVIPESERRHNGVERWTKNVNIFEKDYVIIPINEHFHWNLAIICYPGLVDIDSDPETTHRPCILFFDSLMNKSKDRIATILRGYLAQEYLAKMGEEKSFSKGTLKIIYPKVPKQTNATDCGLYVLQYVEQFFKNPIMDFTVPLDLSQWFMHSVIKQKRAHIASLVAELAQKYNPDEVVSLPYLQFSSTTELANEEDLYFPTKRKNPLYKEKYPSFTTDKKADGDAESCFSAVLKKKKSRQSSLREYLDNVRDASSSSSDQHNLSNLKAPERQIDMNDYTMDSEEDDVVMEESNVPVKNGDESLDIASDIQLPEISSRLSKSLPHRSYMHSYMHKKIGLLTEDFSDSKSHIFEKSIFSDKVGEQSCSSAHPKRECRTKRKSESMMKLASIFQERKKKNESKMGISENEEYKKTSNWIDTSDFKSSKTYSFYNIDEEKGISPSTSYSQFRTEKKFKDQLLTTLKNNGNYSIDFEDLK